MKSIDAKEVQKRLVDILNEVQRQPIVIRHQDREMAVVISIADYERLRGGNVRAFLDLRRDIAAEATGAGLTPKRLAKLLKNDRR